MNPRLLRVGKSPLSLFRHSRYRTRYITIPADAVDHPNSPIRGVRRARLYMFYVIDGEIVDPTTWRSVGRLSIESEDDRVRGRVVILLTIDRVEK